MLFSIHARLAKVLSSRLSAFSALKASCIPKIEEQKKVAKERSRLINEKKQLEVQVEYLEQDLEQERKFSRHLLRGIEKGLEFLEKHLPEKFLPLIEKVREMLPVLEIQLPEQEQERNYTWGDMER